ncbi:MULTISPECIES: universal stress protein [Acinetobacter]|uniref:Universal stress protein n=2 Tax=Acinetobacter TaxID=469 RepID=A0A4Q7B0W6_9GAMM|nr:MULTISPECIES: universal stress protein [Acinetobacter]MCW8039274.1 universal stress protein [Acinetobacter entericus]RZG66596.1 universal stress protein [Acinetobacter bouvetii]TCB71486.1 universal stress protein [Acinetobacter sp. ANC 4177]
MSYNQILVPVDGSQISFSAVKTAAQIAKAFNSKLTLISLVAEDPFTDADFYYSSAIMKEYFVQAHENATKSLADALEIAKAEDVDAETQVIKGQVSAEGIAETASELKADLIVMGSHGRKGFQKMLLGSFAQDVLRNTELPVLIIKS